MRVRVVSQVAAFVWRSKVLSPLIMVAILIAIFRGLSPHLLSVRNLQSLVELLPELGVITLGMAMLIIAGEFDLSVGAVLSLAPLITLRLLDTGVWLWMSVLVTLICCILIGCLHWFITIKIGIPSFITTLAGLMAWRGVVLAVTKGFPMTVPSKASIVAVVLAQKVGPLRISFFYFLVIFLLLWLALERTRLGNWIFAVGGNQMTAYIRGVNPQRVKLFCFVLCSTLAGFAGLVQASRLGVALATAGSEYELLAIAGAVIGGCSLAGGKGSVAGAALGAFAIQLIQNGLILAGVPGYWFKFFVGLVIVSGVIFGRVVEQLKGKKGG